MSLFYLVNFYFFLSIELDAVMEKEKTELGKVRFSIRNCKTETMSSDETSYIFIFITCFYSWPIKIE